MTPAEAEVLIETLTPTAIVQANELTKRTFRTRGGRIGSGMGLLLEALWGYFINFQLDEVDSSVEIGWIATHEYNDFACMERDVDWDPASRLGEVLRIEIKSMVASADESKAHFDKTILELAEHDILVVLLWDWMALDERRRFPCIVDYFVGNAREVAKLRDALHVARGGSFVIKGECPDGCDANACTHVAEPLNAKGKRERMSGPATRKPANTSHAANFGGLVRMLKTSNQEANNVFRKLRTDSETAHRYVSFIHRNLTNEEFNQYTRQEWDAVAAESGVSRSDFPTRREFLRALEQADPNYRDKLRLLV